MHSKHKLGHANPGPYNRLLLIFQISKHTKNQHHFLENVQSVLGNVFHYRTGTLSIRSMYSLMIWSTPKERSSFARTFLICSRCSSVVMG